MRKKKPILLSILVVVVLLIVGFLVWASSSNPVMERAEKNLLSNHQVNVSLDPWLVFSPINENPTTGLIFYPGGRVDPKAYSPLANELARSGYQVVIVPMPLNLAIFGSYQAAKVMEKYPEVTEWVIAGHSLGGAMAAHYIHDHPDELSGLILLASYPAKNDDLSSIKIKVLSISGTNDGLATPEKIESFQEYLPDDTQWLVISGANHAQFGWYGEQSGDLPAEISREEQQELTIKAMKSFLQKLN